MIRFITLLILTFTSHLVLSQGVTERAQLKKDSILNKLSGKPDSLKSTLALKTDSLSFKIPGDSASRKALLKADSIQSGFQRKADSLQVAYRKPINKLDSMEKRVRNEIRVLTSMNLPTSKLTSKADSIAQLKTKRVYELNEKMQGLKDKASKGLDSLNLPPEIKAHVQKITSSVSSYRIPLVDGKIPGLDVSSAKLPMSMPNINTPTVGSVNLSDMNTSGAAGQLGNVPSMGNISSVTGQAGQVGNEIKNITSGNLPDANGLDKKLEGEAMKKAPVGELTGKTAEIDAYTKQLANRPDSAALNMVKTEAMKEATNHFAGKEAVLKESMDKMAKLKQRYSDVKSMADLPKKLPNPLHDKPFIERVVPGITFQVLSMSGYLTDINLGAMYLIRPRLSAGAGYVYRVSFADNHYDNTVYGPRGAFQFTIGKGFSARFLPEILNAYVPPGFNPNPGDNGNRVWIWSNFVGLKKEFKVYKNLKGSTEGLYNIHQSEVKGAYGDKLVVRVGFEMVLRKKKK